MMLSSMVVTSSPCELAKREYMLIKSSAQILASSPPAAALTSMMVLPSRLPGEVVGFSFG